MADRANARSDIRRVDPVVHTRAGGNRRTARAELPSLDRLELPWWRAPSQLGNARPNQRVRTDEETLSGISPGRGPGPSLGRSLAWRPVRACRRTPLTARRRGAGCWTVTARETGCASMLGLAGDVSAVRKMRAASAEALLLSPVSDTLGASQLTLATDDRRTPRSSPRTRPQPPTEASVSFPVIRDARRSSNPGV